jgi:hypothetical protein
MGRITRIKQWVKRQRQDPQLTAFWKSMGVIVLVVLFGHFMFDDGEEVSRALAMIGAMMTLLLFKAYEIAEILRRRRWPSTRRDPRTDYLKRGS